MHDPRWTAVITDDYVQRATALQTQILRLLPNGRDPGDVGAPNAYRDGYVGEYGLAEIFEREGVRYRHIITPDGRAQKVPEFIVYGDGGRPRPVEVKAGNGGPWCLYALHQWERTRPVQFLVLVRMTLDFEARLMYAEGWNDYATVATWPEHYKESPPLLRMPSKIERIKKMEPMAKLIAVLDPREPILLPA